MTDTLTNPLLTHPVFAPIVREVHSGALGQRLAAYASGRTKRHTGDSLVEIGAPLIDFLIQTLGDDIESVMATNERVGGNDLDAWFLTLRFSDGLVATVDLGNFLPATYPEDLELRLEISGTDAVIIAEPENVAVTVIGANGTTQDNSYTRSYHDDFRQFASDIASDVQRPVMRVIDAARRSAASDSVVAVG
jgi:predicted dehydrogenase